MDNGRRAQLRERFAHLLSVEENELVA
jgi:hypothetical protein